MVLKLSRAEFAYAGATHPRMRQQQVPQFPIRLSDNMPTQVGALDAYQLDPSEFVVLPISEVFVHELVATQEYADASKLQKVNDAKPISVVVCEGKRLIADGHHRVLKALYEGRHILPAYVIMADQLKSAGKVTMSAEEEVKERNAVAFSRAVERVNFAVIDRRQTMLSDNLTEDLSTLMARSTNRLLGTPEQLAKLIDNDVSDIAGAELSGVEKGKAKNLCQRALNSAWIVGQQMAMEELRKVGSPKMQRVDMADIRDNAAQFFEANGFRMAGNLADAVKAIIQAELQNSVKFGRTPVEARAAIWARLVAKGMTSREAVKGVESDEGVLQALDALWTDDEETGAAYLDTLTRTNLFEAMNEARYAEFTDPALNGFVVALRYSAVLDTRTTEICTQLHDRVYKTDNPVWDDVRPPNHYNCRSLLIPITQLDLEDREWDGVEALPPPVEPQVGFGKEARA
jgi:SPP1 gp7 family putative phage head morphogenesis protein